jgi:hypothetical protein
MNVRVLFPRDASLFPFPSHRWVRRRFSSTWNTLFLSPFTGGDSREAKRRMPAHSFSALSGLRLLRIIFLLAAALSGSGCNPFAPGYEESPTGASSLISDGKEVNGIFQNMRYAYTFKDTTIYGGLLASNFIFSYRDYEGEVKDVSWGRDEEMRITSRLFENATVLNLIWNNIIGESEDSLNADVTRSFTLTVTFNPNDIVRVDGHASLRLARPTSQSPWQIVRWQDESNY